MKSYVIPIKKLILFKNAGRRFCLLPYPNHPKGCPNYYKKKACPPLAPLASTYFDIFKPLYFIHSEFNLDAHIERMRQKHPQWTGRQCRNVLYWQGTSRKQTRERVKKSAWELNTNAITECPEGMGINVYVTARISGLKLEKIRYLNPCIHISILGTRRKVKNSIAYCSLDYKREEMQK